MAEKKTPWMEYWRKATWVLALFGLIVITSLMVNAMKIEKTPMGPGDFFVVFAIDFVALIVVQEVRRYWRLSK